MESLQKLIFVSMSWTKSKREDANGFLRDDAKMI